MTDKTTKSKGNRFAVYISDDKLPGWESVVERYGAGASGTLKLLIENEVRRIKGVDTKERRLQRIEAAIQSLGAKIDILLYLEWAHFASLTNDGVAKVSADDVRQIKATVNELLSD